MRYCTSRLGGLYIAEMRIYAISVRGPDCTMQFGEYCRFAGQPRYCNFVHRVAECSVDHDKPAICAYHSAIRVLKCDQVL